jgi:hypothetical protein
MPYLIPCEIVELLLHRHHPIRILKCFLYLMWLNRGNKGVMFTKMSNTRSSGYPLSVFRPRGVPGPTSKLSMRVPAQMGRCEMEHKGEKREPRLVLSCAQGGCACSRRLQAFAREGESLLVSPSSRVATFSYEGPGPSFYRCKERVQVYNGGCSNVLTCPAERSQSPMYMPSWLSERC